MQRLKANYFFLALLFVGQLFFVSAVVATESDNNTDLSNKPIQNNTKLPNAKDQSKSDSPDISETESTNSNSNISIKNQDSIDAKLRKYTAEFAILDGNEVVGNATRKLYRENQNWVLQQSTSIKRWYYKYYFIESSQFSFDAEGIRSKKYSAITKRSFKEDRIIKSSFDWDKNIETMEYNRNKSELTLERRWHDHLNYQLALRLNVNTTDKQLFLPVSYKGERSEYQFIREGSETIDTPLGSFKTELWTQIPAYKSDKIIYMWLAPELDYFPIQMAQYRDGQSEGKIRLQSITFSD